MTVIEIMKLGDVLHELDNTSDSVLNIIRVLRGIPGKDHDDDVDALYRVYDDIHAEMERLAKGIGNDTEPKEAYWYVPYFDNKPADFIVCSNCRKITPNSNIATKYCPNCGRLMSFERLEHEIIFGKDPENEQTSEEKEDEESSN